MSQNSQFKYCRSSRYAVSQ